MSNVTVVFHNSLLPYTGGTKKVDMTPDTIYFLFLNCLNLFPDLERFSKQAGFSKLEDIAIINNNRYLSQEEFLFSAKEGETFYLVPIFKGSGAEAMAVGFIVGFTMGFTTSMLSGGSFGQSLLRGLIGGAAGAIGGGLGSQFYGPVLAESAGAAVAGEAAASMGTTIMAPTITSKLVGALASAVGGYLQNALVPIKPKNKTADSVDSGDRPGNDAFDGQVNTISSNQSLPINYGMIRVSGQIISADVNTVNHGKSEQIKVVDYV